MFRRKSSLGCNDVKQSSNAVSKCASFFSYIEKIYTLHTVMIAIYETTMYYDNTLLKEILKVNPFQYKVGIVLRGKAWVAITEIFTIRECYTLLKSKFSKRKRFEENASGINLDYSEIDILMQDVIDFETAQNDINLNNKENQKKNDVKKKKQAENMRLKCMETLGEIQKREGKGIKKYQKVEIENWI